MQNADKLRRGLLEICVETLEAAQAAERGGAHRLELCADLRHDGLTPPAELMRAVRQRVRIPVYAMIRPRAGDFVYSAEEFAAMREQTKTARALGMDGLALGILTAEGRVDITRTRRLVHQAAPLPVTFHRAFDRCGDLYAALEDVIAAGAAALLTSGGAPGAPQGAEMIARLAELAAGRIAIIAGAGINAANLPGLLARSRVREIHAGLSSVLPRPQTDFAAFEAEVRAMAALLR